MTVLEYLLRPEALRKEIARKTLRVGYLRQFADRLTSRIQEARVTSSPDPARMQAFLSEAADEETEIARLREELERVVCETAIYLSFLPDEHMIQLMELRYLDGMPWMDIAVRMDYHISAVYKINNRALEMLPPPPAVAGDSPV